MGCGKQKQGQNIEHISGPDIAVMNNLADAVEWALDCWETYQYVWLRKDERWLMKKGPEPMLEAGVLLNHAMRDLGVALRRWEAWPK